MSAGDRLASLNAFLNAFSACALFAGYLAIRARNIRRHRAFMITALVASALFLASYLARLALTGVHRFPLEGPVRTAYYLLLGSHTILAVVALPFVLRTIWLSAVRRSFEKHRRIAVWTFPIWAYVSVTGVLVYLMLYHLPPWVAKSAARLVAADRRRWPAGLRRPMLEATPWRTGSSRRASVARPA